MFSPPGYQGAWVYNNSGSKGSSEKVGGSGYSDEWIINDPSATRNRYLFEWWTNGVHYIRQDWAIDDNRVVNANEGLKLFTVTLDPLPNQHIRHRTAEIDKITYGLLQYVRKNCQRSCKCNILKLHIIQCQILVRVQLVIFVPWLFRRLFY